MKRKLLWIGLLAVGILAVGAASGAARKGHAQHGPAGGKSSGGETLQSSKSHVCKMGLAHMEAMAALKQLLQEAKEAADGGDAKKASKKIAEAQQLMEKQHTIAHARMQKAHAALTGGVKCPYCGKAMSDGGVVNTKCPIMGGKIDPAKVPAKLTRTFHGKKVGFCCGGCPVQWDKLADDAKAKKLHSMTAE